MIKKNYLLVSLNFGWFDGFYNDKKNAERCLRGLQEEFPNEQWVLTEFRCSEKRHAYLPDRTFHCYARGRLEKAINDKDFFN